VTIETRDLDKGLRGTLWAALKAHGFTERTERVAWRYVGDDVDVVEVQAVGQHAEVLGCPALSVSAIVAAYPRFLPRASWLPAKDGHLRPHYWHCDPFRRFMSKTLKQPWFRPFGEPRDRRMLSSFRLHRDALKRIIDPSVRDRPETWYMRDDGSNLGENLEDITQVVLSTGLDLLDQFHDPRRVHALIENGSLLSPTSPRARELKQAIEGYLAIGSVGTPTSGDIGAR
jgi:hypothetical protein